MGKISMIGKSLAKKGQIFTYFGPAEECESCKLIKVCQDLVPGKRYKVSAVREKEHECPIHEGGKVVVVEVEEVPIEVSISDRKALEGAVVTLDEKECPQKWCQNYWLCRREPFGGNVKVSVLSIQEVLECPRKLKLKRSVVTLE